MDDIDLINDDITGYLAHEYIRKMVNGDTPTEDEFEAAAFEGCLFECHKVEYSNEYNRTA